MEKDNRKSINQQEDYCNSEEEYEKRESFQRFPSINSPGINRNNDKNSSKQIRVFISKLVYHFKFSNNSDFYL